jgi:hypothetical protein
MRIPVEWQVVQRRTTGPFDTSMVLRRPDGSEVTWSAWHHRKGLGLVVDQPTAIEHRMRRDSHSRNWWIGALFMIGSACFAAGSIPPLASALPGDAGLVFFIGSIFFTSAASLQFVEASNEGDEVDGSGRSGRLVMFRPRSAGWWAALTQLIGTLWFNIDTFDAMRSLPPGAEPLLVWTPDAIGSALFLIASAFALVEVCESVRCWRWDFVPWRIAALNMVGSIAFGVSAIAARYLADGSVANANLANSGTFVGAVCFFLGAWLLIPATDPTVTAPHG